jgi:predicted nucleotidyltransferase
MSVRRVESSVQSRCGMSFGQRTVWPARSGAASPPTEVNPSPSRQITIVSVSPGCSDRRVALEPQHRDEEVAPTHENFAVDAHAALEREWAPVRTRERLDPERHRAQSSFRLVSRDEQRTIVHAATILRGAVGSTVHGLHHGGQDDRDEMAIFVEPPEFLLGLRLARSGRRWARFEHFVERTQPEGVRSGPGDLDLVGYSLRRWLRLALTGNPTVLLLLFSPPATLSVLTPAGEALRELAPAIVSRAAGPRFLGYLRAQNERFLGTRGQRRINRPELVRAHGYDTKYAMHVLRLGLQGVELMKTGRLTLPMNEPDRSRVMAARLGEKTYDEVVAEIAEVERALAQAIETSPLPPEPDHARVDAFAVATYRDAWGW